jgi:four helix bundle protein
MEAAMQHFKNLKVWERSHSLTLDVYRLTRAFPKEELYGLTSQRRRSAASIGANIAEGSCRGGDADFARFIQIATGSASELEYHALLAHDLELLQGADYRRLSTQTQEVKRMLTSLLHKLRADS